MLRVHAVNHAISPQHNYHNFSKHFFPKIRDSLGIIFALLLERKAVLRSERPVCACVFISVCVYMRRVQVRGAERAQ